MSKKVLKQLSDLQPGDLVCLYWNDASIGSSLTTGGIPVPVKSVGIFVGYAGEPKHFILAQNDFAYNYEMRDVDYTAIPCPWFNNIDIIKRGYVAVEEAAVIFKNIITSGGTRRRRRRIFQMKAVNHEKLD